MSQNEGTVSNPIDGFRYKVYMLDPLVAADTLADLGHLLAPVAGSLGGSLAVSKGDALGTLLDGVEEGEDAQTLGLNEAIERAVVGFFERFSKAKQRELFNLMMNQTSVIMPDGTEPRLSKIFSVHFKGRLKPMYLWFFFAMKVQFSDFFSGPGGDMSRVIARVTESLGASE